jgi:hypothetical protein
MKDGEISRGKMSSSLLNNMDRKLYRPGSYVNVLVSGQSTPSKLSDAAEYIVSLPSATKPASIVTNNDAASLSSSYSTVQEGLPTSSSVEYQQLQPQYEPLWKDASTLLSSSMSDGSSSPQLRYQPHLLHQQQQQQQSGLPYEYSARPKKAPYFQPVIPSASKLIEKFQIGDKLYNLTVTHLTNYAAFLSTNIYRKAKHGQYKKVNAFLHRNDMPRDKLSTCPGTLPLILYKLGEVIPVLRVKSILVNNG